MQHTPPHTTNICDICVCVPSVLQVTALDFPKEKEPSLHNATLLGGLAKSAAPLLLGAALEGAAAAAAGSLPLPQELLHAEVRLLKSYKQIGIVGTLCIRLVVFSSVLPLDLLYAET
jgi:hypothetical protein